MAYDYKAHTKSGQTRTGGRARGGHRTARAQSHARTRAKANGRIIRTAATAHPRMGKLSILRNLLKMA